MLFARTLTIFAALMMTVGFAGCESEPDATIDLDDGVDIDLKDGRGVDVDDGGVDVDLDKDLDLPDVDVDLPDGE